jgi:hypothetical protein
LQVIHHAKDLTMFWKLFDLPKKLDWIFGSDWICLDDGKCYGLGK